MEGETLCDSAGERGGESKQESESKSDRKLMSSVPVCGRWEEGSKGGREEGERCRLSSKICFQNVSDDE